MPTAPLTAELRLSAPDVARRLAPILLALAALVASALSRHPTHIRHVYGIWARVTRASHRFARLMDRLAAGKPTRVRAKRPPAVPRPPIEGALRTGPNPAGPIPRGHGWLIHAIPYHAMAYTSQLEHLFAQPDARAVLEASPQAARLLRPICRLLGLQLIPGQGLVQTPIPPLRRPRGTAAKPAAPPQPDPKPPRRLSRKARAAILWYPNFNNRPIKLLPPKNRDI